MTYSLGMMRGAASSASIRVMRGLLACLVRVAVALTILSLSGCQGEWCEDPDFDTRSPVRTWTFVLANDLDQAHRADALEAIEEWRQAIPCEGVAFKIIDGYVGELQDVLPTRGTIEIGRRPVDVDAVGRTWQTASGRCGARSVVRPDVDGQAYRKVLRHEIGHAFDLQHTPDGSDSVLATGGWLNQRVSKLDAKAYADRWCPGQVR